MKYLGIANTAIAATMYTSELQPYAVNQCEYAKQKKLAASRRTGFEVQIAGQLLEELLIFNSRIALDFADYSSIFRIANDFELMLGHLSNCFSE